MVQLANGDLSFVARCGWQHRWNDELWVDFVEFHLADPIRLWIQERFGCTENDASKVRSSSRDNDR